MFPRLRQQVLARVDLLVELSTLGEYGIDEHGKAMTLNPEPALCPQPDPARIAPRLRDDCGDARRSARLGLTAGRGAPARP